MKKTRQEKFETAVDIISLSSVVVFLTCPWALYIEALNTEVFGRIPAMLYVTFSVGIYPFIFGIFWLRGRYRETITSHFHKLLGWGFIISAFMVLVILPIYLINHYNELRYNEFYPKGTYVPYKKHPLDNAASLYLAETHNISELIIEYFPLLLIFMPFLALLFRQCDFGNQRNVLYLSLSLPGVLGIIALTILSLMPHLYIVSFPGYFPNLGEPIFNFTFGIILLLQTPCIFPIITAFQLFFIARKKQANSNTTRKAEIYLYCTLIVFAYFWIPIVNESWKNNHY